MRWKKGLARRASKWVSEPRIFFLALHHFTGARNVTKWDREQLDKLKKPKHSLMTMFKKDSASSSSSLSPDESTANEGLHDL